MRFRPLLAALGLSVLLSACGSRRSRVHIVTHYSKLTESHSDSVDRFSFSAPGLYPIEHEVEVEADEFVLTGSGRTIRFPRTGPGHFVLNFSPDTLASMPLAYGTAWDQYMNASETRRSGNKKVDSLLEVVARKNEERRAASGKTDFQLLLPDSLKLVSRNQDAKLFISHEAPKQIEVARGENVEYYQIASFERLMKEALQQMNAEQPDSRELLQRAIRSDQ
ncbi:MAG: hypothetical protein EOO11_18195 [Chitinophagaceae bacterium]|nr:MAG: hypothetical protein EOO11_18195 [Chitinophagaceae bacterium]